MIDKGDFYKALWITAILSTFVVTMIWVAAVQRQQDRYAECQKLILLNPERVAWNAGDGQCYINLDGLWLPWRKP